jgi:hypothetical protein
MAKRTRLSPADMFWKKFRNEVYRREYNTFVTSIVYYLYEIDAKWRETSIERRAEFIAESRLICRTRLTGMKFGRVRYKRSEFDRFFLKAKAELIATKK